VIRLDLASILLGFAAGILLTALVARHLTRRYLRRLQTTERRLRAAERMAEIGAMTGGLAHEIKNPLSTIGLNAQLLAEGIDELPVDEADKGRLSRRVGALKREVDRLRGILTDFLQYAGQLRIEPVPADLNTVVEELADFFGPQAKSQGVHVRCTLAPGPLSARLDVPHIKQAVLNLMLNAVQAMQENPPERPRELILRTAREQDADRRPVVTLHVIDTGPGIPEDRAERIFQPYFTTKSGGTGLGLPTARRLIEGHEGRLEVHTEAGRGTDFTMVLPAP
jgi:signal transduction histidine kinase